MSLSETPRSRRTLSLPGYVRPPVPASPLVASATGATVEVHQVPETVSAALERPEGVPDRDQRALGRGYHARMLDELAGILAAPAPPLFTDRIPKPFRANVHAEMVARYVSANPMELAAWLQKWSKTAQYILAVTESMGTRYDLDGKPGKAGEPYDPDGLSKTFHARMLAELVGILGAPAPVVLLDRVPTVLKIGIREDILALYPAADTVAVGRWLCRWVSTGQYRRQLAAGGWRFDLTGREDGEISPDAVEFARQQLTPKVAS